MRTKQLKRVVFLVMPGSHSLELTGPYDAFATAARNAARQNLSTAYEMEVYRSRLLLWKLSGDCASWWTGRFAAFVWPMPGTG